VMRKVCRFYIHYKEIMKKKLFKHLFFSISFQNTLESQQDKLDMMINNAADAEKSTHNEDQKVKVIRRNSHATVE